jgi:hypothetical protein
MRTKTPFTRAISTSVAIVALAGVLAVGGASSASGRAGAQQASTTTPAPVSRSALAFHDAMRKLWEDHITWTRDVIISFKLNEPDPSAVLPDLNAALGRLLQNQVDIGDAIKPYYGETAGNQLAALLHDHITIAGEILAALKTGDSAALADAQERWYANAHDIAVFLSTANPESWPLAEMDQMLKDHLDATTAEAVARFKGDWSGDVTAYDNVHIQALGMADMLSNGIIDQFPALFRP